jgi:hypothetical protein
MRNKEYIEALAAIYTNAGAALTNLANSESADDKAKWLPEAERIVEGVESAVAELPTEVDA